MLVVIMTSITFLSLHLFIKPLRLVADYWLMTIMHLLVVVVYLCVLLIKACTMSDEVTKPSLPQMAAPLPFPFRRILQETKNALFPKMAAPPPLPEIAAPLPAFSAGLPCVWARGRWEGDLRLLPLFFNSAASLPATPWPFQPLVSL